MNSTAKSVKPELNMCESFSKPDTGISIAACFQQANEEDGKPNGRATGAENAGPPGRKLGKDPTVHTEFLPDKDREAEELSIREQLKKEYELRQKVPCNAVADAQHPGSPCMMP
jgi:hypothetical protein